MKLDLDYLKANAPSVTTPVICTELKDNQKIRLITDGPIKAGELSTQLTPTRSNSYILKQFKGIGCHGDGGSSSKMRHIYRGKDWKAHRCHYYGLQPPHEPYPPHGIKSRDRRKIKGWSQSVIEKNYPESFALAGEICKELGKDLNHEFWTMRQATLPYISSRLRVWDGWSIKNVKPFLHIRLCVGRFFVKKYCDGRNEWGFA